MTLLEKLTELQNSDMVPFHMPGHKRASGICGLDGLYGIDITEIDDFDDLHHPEGIIQNISEKAAKLYGCQNVFLSVNGSTAANEAAILSVCGAGDEILVARGCHKSVYFALEIGHLRPSYIYQNKAEEVDVLLPVTAMQVEQAMDIHPGAKCVVITSPTYEGVSADVAEIANIVHERGGILIVDAAHGAHFGLSDLVPINPISQGADIVIVSLHKTLPSPTQTALLLVNSDKVDLGRVQHFMSVFQSSSPSYVLMAGIDECIEYMSKRGKNNLDHVLELSKEFKKNTCDLKFINTNPLPLAEDFKLIIKSKLPAFTGKKLYDALRDNYHIQCEMYTMDHVLAMLSPMDERESMYRLESALRSIDEKLSKVKAIDQDTHAYIDLPVETHPKVHCQIYEAVNSTHVYMDADEKLIGKVAADYCMAYPPGIPIVVPGEIIDADVIGYIHKGMEMKLNIIGLKDGQISVIK